MIQPKIIYTKCNQNTPLPAFSVTDYDDLGRIEAVFEYCTSETIDLENAKDPHELAGFLDDPNSIKREYFRTFYDESPFLPQASDFWPENLQNRVACQAYYEEDPNPNSFDEPDAAYHYSYDIHGNVKTLLQQDTDMADYEWGEIITEYEYEIGSGNVLLVKYQEGKNDRMYHKYFYDADNRIIEVQTSNTQANKGLRTEAEYFYYPHGPLARVELGDKNRKVQGMDYIYTINGWIKAVNASTIDTTRDAGKDGKRKLPLGGVNPHRSIAADAFAYSLHYYENDYTPAVPNQGLIISFNGSGLQEAIKGSGLYNGNITAQVIALRKPEDNSPKIPLAGYAYQYDRLNRLKHMNSSVDFNGEADSGNSWNNIAINSYRSNYSYDANGNITRLDRFDIDSVLIDSLLYHYNTNNNGRIINNRLDYITQSVSTNPNLSDQNSNNYEYDEIGNLISDAIHEISNIEWNSFGKVKMVEFNSKLPLWFRYDSYGRRVMKYDQSLDRATFYTYDASGNVMGIYERKFDGQHDALYISQLPMYGSSRLGVINSNTKLSFDNGNGIVVCDNLHDDNQLNIKYVYCDRQYELTNHLGNVMTTISDDRMGVADNSSFPSTVLYYLPKILTTTDYYPFGMQMPDRSYVATTTGYRFGFNNMEKDDELKGPGNSYDFGARIYDLRVGRWLSVDPLFAKFPNTSPYTFSHNNPVYFIDEEGKEPIKPLAGTIAQFKAVLDNSPRKVGMFMGSDAHNYLMSLGNTTMNWQQVRPEPTETPYFNRQPARYIYTEKGGWIDMTHFLFYAGRAYKYKVQKENAIKDRMHAQSKMEEACANGGCFWPPIIPKSQIEDICPVGKAVQDGYIQEMTDRWAAPHSAYSYEDIPSNYFGADFGANYFDPNSSLSFSEQLESYFINVLQATNPQSAPNYAILPETDPTDNPSRTNHTTTPVFTTENP